MIVPNRINEQFVENSVKKYLEIFGYVDKSKYKELWEHGVDIKMKHKEYGRYYLVECKGDPGARGHVKSVGGSMSSSLNSAVGQIISRMHTRNKSRYGGYNYAVAFPETFEEKALKRIPYYVCKNLHMRIFIVNHSGGVKKYEWSDIKKWQTDKILDSKSI